MPSPARSWPWARSSPSPGTRRDCRADGAQEAGGRSTCLSEAAPQVSSRAGRRLRPDLPLGPAGMEEAATAEGCGGAPRVPDPPLRPRALPDQRLLSPQQRPLRVAEDPPADLRRGRGGRSGGGDRPRRVRRGRDRGGRRALAPDPRDARVERPDPDREHRGRRECGGAPLRCPRPALGSSLEEQVGDRDRVLFRHLPRARRRGGARRRHRAGGGDRRQDRSASRERLARSTGNRSGPSREPRQGRDRRGDAPRDDQGGRPAGDRRNARRNQADARGPRLRSLVSR